ncbi:PRC-barrel domain-containing protein [Rhodococcus sp. AQ5-07]|uniref:PRC-barrel domain-containing protein n=1 Tax=Rhodococcus sp. AQ5-07 TaxID=2054902 RepID=UPI000DBF5F8F|nr:PRC-barrel domain-containing protein [Rhodococcus sp. AQ5-07]RAL30807.1 hypothetical protein CVN56_31195 [Rhodococcus sp. AQ5-07]
MLFSAVSGRQIVGSGAADTIGEVAGLVVDPTTRRILAVHVKKAESGSVLPWSKIGAFGDDAVIVDTSQAITDPDDETAALEGKSHNLLGKRVLTSAGNQIGTIDDVDFDPQSGAITSLILDTEDVPGHRLVGVGSYAVVVDTH